MQTVFREGAYLEQAQALRIGFAIGTQPDEALDVGHGSFFVGVDILGAGEGVVFLFAFLGKLAARHYMCNQYAMLMKPLGVFLRTTSRSEDYLHAFFNDYIQ